MQAIEQTPFARLERFERFGFASTQVIIAALNEEQDIGLTITELQANLGTPKVMVVDGNSRDKTVEVAKNCGVDILLQDGVGKGEAISKALKNMAASVDYVVFTDADYTYSAEYLPEMIELLEKNPAIGMVCGNRFNDKVDAKALCSQFYFGNRLLAFVHNRLNGVSLSDPLTGLRVIRASILKEWTAKSKGLDLEVELNSLVKRRGFKTFEVPICYRHRLGERKPKVKHGATILKRILVETLH